MEKVTLVSLYPLLLDERKPGIYPGHFTIPPVKDGDIEILHLGNSHYWVNFYDDRPPLKVNTPADEIATSVINDLSRNIIGYDLQREAWPGLFWVEGHFTKAEILKNYASKIAETKAAQHRWFENLVRMADDLWVASNKQNKAISQLHRLACKALGVEREWSSELATAIGPKYCPACKERVHEEAVICKCRFILDEVKYKSMKFAAGA